MKVLLISDIPPCNNFTAGIVLSAMVRFLPRGTVCCFVVVNPMVPLRMSPEFGGVPVEFHRKPLENWAWLPKSAPFDRLASLVARAGETSISERRLKSLIGKAIAFGRKQQVDRVWAVLQGQTTIRMALAVAEGLNVPLHCQVWDPFSWWARANRLDRDTTQKTQQLFDRTIERSAAVATASHPMANNFRDRFGTRAIPIISSYPRAMARTAAAAPLAGASITIGMAGQFYAADEWLRLLAAVQAVNWSVGGRRVNIIVMGPGRPPAMPAGHVTFLGWKSQTEAVRLLNCCDFLYCPYPFDPAMEQVARLSFPSKLVLYLAAGRPVIFHGPAYSAPAHYIAHRGCGILATGLRAEGILREIERMTENRQLYSAMASKAQQAFLKDFTLESMARSFNEFIGAEAGGGMLLHNHARHSGDELQPDRLPPSLPWSALSLIVKYARKARNVVKAARARAA
jgi:glycosyltransferase involved in cell wall biosynthesis